MGIIQKILENRKRRQARFDEYSEDDRVRNTLDARKKSHNERVLIEMLEKEKQEAIKDAVQWTNKVERLKEKQGTRNFWKFNKEWFNEDSNVVLNQPSVILRSEKW